VKVNKITKLGEKLQSCEEIIQALRTQYFQSIIKII